MDQVNDLSSGQHSVNKNIGFKTSMLRSDLCAYSDVYIIVKGTVSVEGDHGDKTWNDDTDENNAVNKKINNNKTITSSSFEYKTKLIGSTRDNASKLNPEIVVPLKYLSNIRRPFDMSFINCEIELDLSWSKECIISEISRTTEIRGNNRVTATETTGATFQINIVNLHVWVVFLSINDNIKFLEKIKQGFKGTISWDKYRSEITAQSKINNLDFLTDPAFTNRLFVLSFKNGNDDPTLDSFDNYYIPLDFKAFLYQPLRNKQEAYEELTKMSRNNDYTTRILLDYLYHQKYCKRIGIALSVQTNTSISQQIAGKTEENYGVLMFLQCFTASSAKKLF